MMLLAVWFMAIMMMMIQMLLLIQMLMLMLIGRQQLRPILMAAVAAKCCTLCPHFVALRNRAAPRPNLLLVFG